jgi:general secretion pathway protein J
MSKSKFYPLTGFTLLEVLVVLIFIALLSTLLFQGITYVLYLRSQFLVQFNQFQQGLMQEYWFRNSIEGIVADYEAGDHIFKGDSQELSGLTLAAIDALPGTPTPFAWQLQFNDEMTILRYKNSQNEFWEIHRWLGKEGYFSYMDIKGDWHRQWPPTLGTKSPQIPRFIRLEGRQGQFPFTWIVKLAEDDQTKIDFRLRKENF